MKFEHSTYQQPLSMVGLGGGATSLGRGGASAQNYWRLPQIDLQYLLKHQFIHLVKQQLEPLCCRLQVFL